jgi:hypothetical protein
MKTTKTKPEGYTPGPWRNHPLCAAMSSAFRGRGIKDETGLKLIARTYEEIKGRQHPTHGESEANARLIAAAPDLLEACRLAKRAFWHIPMPGDEGSKAYKELSEAHDKLVAVIQKATGMSQ